MSRHDELISRYEKGIAAMEDALRGVPEDVIDRVPAPGKWTIRQQAVHVAEAEMVGCVRIRWMAAEPGVPLKAYDQDKWAASLDYGQRSTQDAIELFRVLRKNTTAMLRALPESAWSHSGMHEERGDVTVEEMVELCAEHAEHHAQHIKETRKRFAAAA